MDPGPGQKAKLIKVMIRPANSTVGVKTDRMGIRASTGGWSPEPARRRDTHHHPAEVDYLLARKRAVVGRDHKRIVAADGSDEGYDLIADPGEERPFPGGQTNLSARVPEPGTAETTVALDPLQRKLLEVLGYVQ